MPASLFEDLTKERQKDVSPSGAPSMFEDLSNKSDGSNLVRGVKESFQQIPQLGYGVLAGIGAGIESVAGEGGIGTGLKTAGVEGYNRWGEKIAAGSKESDSWDYSWDQAKQGNFGALVDWLAHGIGYTGGQGIQMLVGAGIGSMVGKATLGTVAESIAQGLVKKEALRIAEEEVAKSATKIGASEIAARAASPEVIKAATSSVASTIGQTSAVAASSFAQEGGEIFGDLVSTAQKEGRQLSGAELGKAFAASLAAGGLEFVGDKLGLDVILGRSKLLKPAEAMTGLGGRAARAGLAAAAQAPIEGATEYLQTGLEQYGKGEEANILPFNQSPEGQKQAREAAALGILGGVVMGGAGGALQGPKKPAQEKPQEEPPKPPLLLPAPTGILGSSAPRPIVQFQDGTYGTVEDAQNYINAQVAAAPPEQQANVRQTLEEQLLGIGRPKPTPAEIAAKTGGRATAADILDADTSAGIDEAIELAQRAVGYRTGLAAIDVQELSIPTLTDVLDGQGLMPEIPVGQASEADLASVRAPLLPVGEATEMLPVGEATEIEDIPIGQASDMVIGATQAWASAERNLQREVDAARINRILDGDLLTKDGMPYGSKTAALLRAKREGLTLDHVIEIPDAGWVVRPNLKIQVAEQPNMQPVQGRPSNAAGFTAENTLQQQQPGATVAQPQEPGVVGGPTGETNGQEGQGQGRRQEVLTPPGGETTPPTAPTGEVTGASQPGGGTTEPPTGIEVARENNTFTGQDASAGRLVGYTQPRGTPADKLFANFADNFKHGPGGKSIAQKQTEFRASMFERANANPRQFKNDDVSTSEVALGESGLNIRVDAAKSGHTRLQVLNGAGEVVAAAQIRKGMIDSMAVVEAAKGLDIGPAMLRFMDDQRIANIYEVPDRSPGFVRAQRIVVAERQGQPTKAPTGEVTGGPNASAGGAEQPGGGTTEPKTPEQPKVEGEQPKPPAEPKQTPAPQEEPKTTKAVQPKPNTIFTEEAASKARELLRKKLGQVSSGIDPEVLQAGITLAGYHIEKGARTFAAYAKAMIADLGEVVKPYLKSWYMGVKYDPMATSFSREMDDEAAINAAEGWKQSYSLKTPEGRAAIAREVADHFLDGKSFDSIVDARKFIAELTGERVEPASEASKMADEAIETGVVMASRDIVVSARHRGWSDERIFDRLQDLYEQQPNLSSRSSTSIREQAYSTPVPLAFLASRLAQISQRMRVGEPTGGNGMLLLEVDPKNAVVNELNPTRLESLRAQGFEPTQNDASTTALAEPGSLDAVVMNPPFGAVKDAAGDTIYYQIAPNITTREVDHAIALEALKSLSDDGNAVLILGGVDARSEDHLREGYRGKSKREFYFTLYSQYNVVDHFTVDGDLYTRQGAGYPVDVIVIRGRGKATRMLPAAELPNRLMNWEQVKEKLNVEYPVVPQGSRPATGSSARPGWEGNGTAVVAGPGGSGITTGSEPAGPAGGPTTGVTSAGSGGSGEPIPGGTVSGGAQPGTAAGTGGSPTGSVVSVPGERGPAAGEGAPGNGRAREAIDYLLANGTPLFSDKQHANVAKAVMGIGVQEQGKSSEENGLGGRARMSTGGTGIGVDRAQEIADSVSAAWASGPEIKVVDTEAELPQSALDEIQRLVVDGAARPSGFFDPSTGAIYMVASNIKSDAEAVKVLLHEAVGHFGMRAVFGADFAKVLDSFSTIAEKRVREMADRLGYDFDNIDDRRAAAEEVLAYMAETDPSYGWVRKIVATIAKWLRSVFPDLSLTDSEIIRDFIVPARDWVAGARQEKAKPAPKTSASDVRFRMLDALRKAGGGPKIVGNVGRQYTPRQLRGMRNTGMLVDKPTLEDRVKDLWSNLGRKIEQGVFDQFAPIQDIDRHAYSLLRLAKGAAGAFQTMLQGGMLKIVDGSYAFDPTRRGGVIERLLKPLQGEHHDFLRWVAANRADQLTQEDREHLFSEQDIEDLRTLADDTTTFDYTLQHNINGRPAGTVTRDRTLIYADAAKTLDEFNKMTLDMAEESGLIDGESRQFWEKEFYVPFYRVADESEGGVRGTNIKSGVVRQEAFKHLKGGTQKLNADLMDNVLMNWAHLLDASAKNRAAKATLDALVDAGHAFESTETAARQAAKSMGVKDHVVWIKDGGTKHFYVVDDPAYMMALTSLEYAGLRGTVMDVMGGLKHAITVGVTASPFFKVRNLIRDSIQSIATSPIGVNPLTNVAEGWKLSNQTSDSYLNLLASGGTIHFGTMLEGSESRRIQALVESGIQDNTILNSDQKYRAFYRKHIEPWLTAYNELGNRGETVNRASLYDQLRKQGLSHTEASIQARDLMDFSMQGTWTAIRFLAQVVPFFNARLQGLYKLKRAAQEDPKRFAAVVGATAAASVMLLLAYSDDDDWRKREDWDRNNFWWFKIGGTAFRIPKPFEVGAIATLAERGFELFFDREMTGKRFRANVLNILSDQLNMDPIPQIAKPMLGVYANVDGYTGRPIETEGQKNLAPEYRFNSSTSMTARAASTGLNTVASWFGGKSLSPVQVDYLIQGYFAWLGTFVVQAADIVARPITDQPERPSRDWLKTATGGMLSDLNDAQSRYVSQMYDQGRVLEQAYHTYRTMLREGKVADTTEYLQEHREEISKYRQLERAKSAETKLNLRQRQIENDSTMSAEQKRNAIREILLTRERIAKPVTEAIQ